MRDTARRGCSHIRRCISFYVCEVQTLLTYDEIDIEFEVKTLITHDHSALKVA